jgi:hypothetical protein
MAFLSPLKLLGCVGNINTCHNKLALTFIYYRVLQLAILPMPYAYYTIDLSIVHGIIFILPCIILTLFKLWTKVVAKSQAEIISRRLNEELIKMV